MQVFTIVGFINPKKSSILHERFYQTQKKQDKKTKIECSFQNKNKEILHYTLVMLGVSICLKNSL